MSLAQPTVLFDAERIRSRITELGREITTAFAGQEVCVVGLMKGCMVFIADLIRVVPLEMKVHFLRAHSIESDSPGAARTDIVYSTEIPYEGRHILLVNDIVDTGITLNYLLTHIRAAQPAALKVCALIDKPRERKVDVHPDWSAFTLEDLGGRFLVGYGLDQNDYYRGLPFIGTVPRAADAPRES